MYPISECQAGDLSKHEVITGNPNPPPQKKERFAGLVHCRQNDTGILGHTTISFHGSALFPCAHCTRSADAPHLLRIQSDCRRPGPSPAHEATTQQPNLAHQNRAIAIAGDLSIKTRRFFGANKTDRLLKHNLVLPPFDSSWYQGQPGLSHGQTGLPLCKIKRNPRFVPRTNPVCPWDNTTRAIRPESLCLCAFFLPDFQHTLLSEDLYPHCFCVHHATLISKHPHS